MGWKRAFSVEGLNLERFLRTAADAGISVDQMRRAGGRRIEAVVNEKDLEKLEAIAREGGWGCSTGSRQGAGSVADRARARWMLAISVLLALLGSLAASQVMWGVRILGAGVYQADLQEALREMGVAPPMFRWQVNPGEIRDALEWRYPEVAWFECGWRGMRLEIRAVEGIADGGSKNGGGPCNVIAARAGVVDHIVTCAGTPVVKPGETVRAGQILIRGEERTSGGETRAVAARGNVYARVWDEASIQTSLYETETVYTGREQITQVAACPWFDLWHAEESGFEQEDVSRHVMPLGGFFLPLTLRTETRLEAEIQSVPRNSEAVRAENAEAALQKLALLVGGQESLIDKWVNWSIINDEILLSVARGERLIDIAQQDRSSGMAAPE